VTSRDFCYWLQGYLEVTAAAEAVTLTAEQIACVQKHLGLVFVHEIDPSFPASQKKLLDALHSGPSAGHHSDLPGGQVMRC